MMDPQTDKGSIVFIEPLYGGSHQQLVDLLVRDFGGDLFTLPSTKWHWRMRVSALHFSMIIPHKATYRTLFSSSVLNLCELVSLRPDLGKLYKVIYFHENQLVYPVRKQQDRDFQYGYNQILSCLVADAVLFNSEFNMSSFLGSIDSFLHLIPDHRPKGLADVIRPKCSVLYFPIHLPPKVSTELEKSKLHGSEYKDSSCRTDDSTGILGMENHDQKALFDSPIATSTSTDGPTTVDVSQCDFTQSKASDLFICKEVIGVSPLHILWPHRWEHDKGPDEFCLVLGKLLELDVDFRVSILGSHTNDIPDCFKTLLPQLGSRLLHQGHQSLKDYHTILSSADVVVSTSRHEFFGVSMLEAVFCGCYSLCPNRLVYPEIYPCECLYNTEQQLFKRLRRFCQYPEIARRLGAKLKYQMNLNKYTWIELKESYSHYLQVKQMP